LYKLYVGIHRAISTQNIIKCWSIT
jgi:hypothetical protein